MVNFRQKKYGFQLILTACNFKRNNSNALRLSINHMALVNSSIIATKTGYFFRAPHRTMFNHIDRLLHLASLSSPHVTFE